MVWSLDGRRTWGGVGMAAAAVLVAAALAGAAYMAFSTSAAIVILLLHAFALLGVVFATMQARAARRSAEKVSSDLDEISRRLIHIETRLPELEQHAGRHLRSNVAEVSEEIGLLSSLVRDLVDAVSGQDRDIAQIKDKLERQPSPATGQPHASPAPKPAPTRPALVAPAPPPARPAETPSFGAPVAKSARAALSQNPTPMPTPPAVPAPAVAPLVRSPVQGEGISDAEARRMAAIVQAFEADRIELHLQPIVALPQRKVRFYEALARLRLADETILVPAEFMPLLERLGHAAEFDRKVLLRATAIVRHLVARGSDAIVSCNLSPQSLTEPGFLRSVGRLVDAYPDAVGKIVLELSQRCWRTLDAERAGALASLRDMGVPFALDRATDLRLDPLALADRGVRFVKLPADLMLKPDVGRGLDIEMTDLAAVLLRAGIKLIAERVEREETVPDLIDLDVPLAQGFVFAPPRAVRAEVLTPQMPAEQAPAPEPVPAPPQAAEAKPQPVAAASRLPYRAFLRRAG